MLSDEEQIRALVQTWQSATQAGDTETVLRLMTDDVVFLVPDRPPMRKAEFTAQSQVPPGCHCGKTAFQIEGNIPAELTRCTCSFCSKRGALVAYYRPDQFQLTTPASDDAIYRWNTKLVAHHFCPTCGIATFSDSPAFETDGSWDKSTRRIGVNARLFDDFDAATAPVTVIDGKNLW